MTSAFARAEEDIYDDGEATEKKLCKDTIRGGSNYIQIKHQRCCGYERD